MTPLDRARTLLDEQDLDVLVLRTRSSFAWLTGGGSATVLRSAAEGVATLVVSAVNVHLVTTEVEAPRLTDEEPVGGTVVVTHPWWTSPEATIAALVAGRRAGADLPRADERDVRASLARARSLLHPDAIEQYRTLCLQTAQVVEDACRDATRGTTEAAIAAAVAGAATAAGIEPVVLLVGGDDRLDRYRHPVPTGAPVWRAAMVVLCGERHGLVANVTRTVRFGTPTPAEQARHTAVAFVQAQLRGATTPGCPHAELFERLRAAYAEVGWAGEWRGHHQGGPTGYAAREWLLAPGLDDVVQRGQAYAWNPSLPGAKFEDTLLVGDREATIMTDTGSWPRLATGPGAGGADVLVRHG